MTENRLVYLYCVANKEPPLEQTGGTAEDLRIVCYAGLHAVSAEVAESEFGDEGLKRNMADLQWVKSRAMLHEKVIEQTAGGVCVIPFKFATLFNGYDSLKAMLEQYAAEFREILDRLDNKQEWGVKIYCDVEQVRAACADDEPEIREIEARIKSSPPGRAFFLRKKQEELLAQSADAKINEFNERSFRSLKQLSVEAYINKLLPKEVTERRDDMVLNSVFLVGKEQVDGFVDAAESLKSLGQGSGFFVDCTGPWPPYNFCGLSHQRGAKCMNR